MNETHPETGGGGAPVGLGRMTPQRQILLDELRQMTSHPTADELYARVRERLPHISLATVYRNLDLMARHGVIRKLEMAGSQSRYDGMIDLHYHVRCVHCGCVEDVHAPREVVDVRELEPPTGYRLLGHRLEFVGECPRCRS